MLAEPQIKEIVQSINEEALRIRYGKLLLQLNVIDGEVVDLEIETRKRVQLKKGKILTAVIKV